MITKLQLTTVCVKDQQAALEFYTEKLGFEVRTDQPFGEMRWIEVAPRGAETGLTLHTPPGMEDRIGSFTGHVFTSEDVEKTYRELVGRGVKFTEKPTKQPWGGLQAQFVDPDGNGFVLHD